MAVQPTPHNHDPDSTNCGACHAQSELAWKIIDALDGNEHWPSHVPIPHDQDIRIGPLVFRYGTGPRRDRWYAITAEQADTDTDPIRLEIARLDALKKGETTP